MILSKFKRKVGMALAGAALVTGGVLASSMPAQAAEVDQAIDHLSTPGDHGYLHATISWYSNNNADLFGELYDTSPDGHGPYYHLIALYTDGSKEQVDTVHGGGSGSSNAVTSVVGGGKNIVGFDVWVCNGGDVNGKGAAEGGCYGRQYYNKAAGYNAGSVALGPTTGGVY